MTSLRFLVSWSSSWDRLANNFVIFLLKTYPEIYHFTTIWGFCTWTTSVCTHYDESNEEKQLYFNYLCMQQSRYFCLQGICYVVCIHDRSWIVKWQRLTKRYFDVSFSGWDNHPRFGISWLLPQIAIGITLFPDFKMISEIPFERGKFAILASRSFRKYHNRLLCW